MTMRRLSILVLMAAMPTAVSLAASFREQVEADWLVQDDVRSRFDPARQTFVKTWEDAAGAVDGRKTGKWEFHTNLDSKPWWHVDLSQPQPLDRVEIWNRTDGAAGRSRHLVVLLSDDAKQWREVYKHNGMTFYGFTDKKPLVVDLKGEAYEGLLQKFAAEQKGAGQYFTPRPLFRAIVQCVRPDIRQAPDFTVHDPAAGTAAFSLARPSGCLRSPRGSSPARINVVCGAVPTPVASWCWRRAGWR